MNLYDMVDTIMFHRQSFTHSDIQSMEFNRFQIMLKNYNRLAEEEKNKKSSGTGSLNLNQSVSSLKNKSNFGKIPNNINIPSMK